MVIIFNSYYPVFMKNNRFIELFNRIGQFVSESSLYISSQKLLLLWYK